MRSFAEPMPSTPAAAIRARQDRSAARAQPPKRAPTETLIFGAAQKKGAIGSLFTLCRTAALRHFLALTFDGGVLVAFLDVLLNLVPGITAADHARHRRGC